MKRFFICALAALAMFSCAKINDLSEINTAHNGGEIAFKTNTSTAPTKAIVDGTVMVDNFGAYGYVLPGTYSVEGGYLMNNAEYEEDGTPANDAHYYWPKSDNNNNIEVIFTAYAQYDENVAYDETTGEVTITIPELTQEIINNPDDFDDVLWAQTKVDYHQNALAEHTKVPLTFRHALSWLQFRAEVAENPSIVWVKVKSVKFGEYKEAVPYQPEVPANPGQEYVPEQRDTTDMWLNLRRSTNVDGSPTRTSTDGGATYVDNFEIPAALVAEIKSYYSINNGTAGDYDLHMGNSVWPSAEIRQLRVVKDVPAAYRMPVEMTSGDVIVFFDALKYLEDNGYKVTYRVSGGKPAIFDYPIIDLFVNGTAYTIVGFNFGVSNVYDASVAGNIPSLEYTIEITPEVPYIAPTEYQPEVPAQPATVIPDGVYTGGSLVLPTRDTVTVAPVATYAGEKDVTLDYCAEEITIYGTSQEGIHEAILSNALVIPQAVPEYITFVFDICVHNSTGDDVIIADRQITRKINSGNDSDGEHEYPNAWIASNKYIYNFKVTVDGVEFDINVNSWDVNPVQQYHVWDYEN